jgi:hypothetical protein
MNQMLPLATHDIATLLRRHELDTLRRIVTLLNRPGKHPQPILMATLSSSGSTSLKPISDGEFGS